MSYRCSYYTLMMWFPELFNRFETFERQQPGVDVSVCQVSSVYIEHDGALNTADLCGSAVGESVYTHTLWIGIACIPTSLWMPLCVHRLGAKFFLGNTLRHCTRLTVHAYRHQGLLLNLEKYRYFKLGK